MMEKSDQLRLIAYEQRYQLFLPTGAPLFYENNGPSVVDRLTQSTGLLSARVADFQFLVMVIALRTAIHSLNSNMEATSVENP